LIRVKPTAAFRAASGWGRYSRRGRPLLAVIQHTSLNQSGRVPPSTDYAGLGQPGVLVALPVVERMWRRHKSVARVESSGRPPGSMTIGPGGAALSTPRATPIRRCHCPD
jgi:hypothetical protein